MKPQFVIDNSRFLLNHPFYQAWMQGTLSPEALTDYAQQYYHHVEAFPRYIAHALKLHGSSQYQEILSENLAEEDGRRYGTSHPELWLRFAEGVGANRDEMKSTNYRPAIRNVVEAFTFASKSSVATALGALYAYESQVPEIAESKIEGLKRHFNVRDQRTLEFFEVHRLADVEHRESVRELIEGLSEAERAEAKEAAARACQVLWDFLSEVYETNGCHCA